MSSDVIQKLSAFCILHHNVDILFVFKSLVEFNNIGVVGSFENL